MWGDVEFEGDEADNAADSLWSLHQCFRQTDLHYFWHLSVCGLCTITDGKFQHRIASCHRRCIITERLQEHIELLLPLSSAAVITCHDVMERAAHSWDSSLKLFTLQWLCISDISAWCSCHGDKVRQSLFDMTVKWGTTHWHAVGVFVNCHLSFSCSSQPKNIQRWSQGTYTFFTYATDGVQIIIAVSCSLPAVKTDIWKIWVIDFSNTFVFVTCCIHEMSWCSI